MIPKAELHCHLEGSIPPALARELATRNGLELPAGLMGADGFYVWQDFRSFLAAYDRVCMTLRTAARFRRRALCLPRRRGARGGEVRRDVLLARAAGGARHPLRHLARFPGAGIDRARRDFGIEGRIVVICIRHLGPDKALAMVRTMVAEPHPLCRGLRHGRRRGQVHARRLRAGLSAGPRQGLWLHRPCRRGDGAGKRVGGHPRPAGDAHRPWRALGRGSGAAGGAGAARDRAGSLPGQQRRARPVPRPRRPSAAPLDRGGRPRHPQLGRPALLPHHARQGIRQGGTRGRQTAGDHADGDRGIVRR